MTSAAQLRFEPTARDGGRVWLGRRVVAEIRRLTLVHWRPAPGARSLVDARSGVPLFWRQYANHQDPERSATSRRRLIAAGNGRSGSLRLRATSETKSGAVQSAFEVTFRAGRGGQLAVEVCARLDVMGAGGWRVTPQADHGELAFCTLWPTGVFTTRRGGKKQFQTCVAVGGGRVWRIPHHHGETRDKQRVRLAPGDCFAWVAETWNPVLTIGEGTRAEAGLCAYMWDAHFGLRVGAGPAEAVLPMGTLREARFTLSAVPRATAERWLRRARPRPAGPAENAPLYTGPRHDFRRALRDALTSGGWPWQRAVVAGEAESVTFARDTRVGHGDRWSVRIAAKRDAIAQWCATTLGPAFGEREWRRGVRLELRGWVRSRGLTGSARLVLRVHRRSVGSVFDLKSYERHESAAVSVSRAEWTQLRVVTPPLSPAPDRVHLLLELTGCGTVWFDDLELREAVS